MMNLVSEFARQTTSRRPKHTAMWMHNSIMRGKLCDEPSPGAQPNKRLKLPGGDRFKETGVLAPWRRELSSATLAPAGESPAA